jgi:hypothetical protein
LGGFGALQISRLAMPSSRAHAWHLTNEIIVTQKNLCDSISI